MYVGIAKISLVIGDSHSLKDKRMVLRKIKDRVRERIGVVVNEVGDLDVWQRSELGCAVVSNDHAKANELLDGVVRMVVGDGVEITAIARDVSTFQGESVRFADKVTAADPNWVPDEWKDQLEGK
ncbi:MAG: DUF503 domain-containing protein [Kofleriaceae bacterium]